MSSYLIKQVVEKMDGSTVETEPQEVTDGGDSGYISYDPSTATLTLGKTGDSSKVTISNDMLSIIIDLMRRLSIDSDSIDFFDADGTVLLNIIARHGYAYVSGGGSLFLHGGGTYEAGSPVYLAPPDLADGSQSDEGIGMTPNSDGGWDVSAVGTDFLFNAGKPFRHPTTATKTGQTWIDGKPIWRKVVSFGAVAAGATEYFPLGIDLDTLVRDYTVVRSVPGGIIPMPFPSGAAGYTHTRWFEAISGSMCVCVTMGTAYGSVSGYTVVEYTSTRSVG